MNKICKLLFAVCTFGILLASPVMGAIQKTGIYPGDSFIDPTVFIDVTKFSIGNESYIAPFTEFTGEYLYIGNYSDVQDSGQDRGNITISDDAVIAHGAELIGEVEIGEKAFIGFNSVIKDSKIGDGAYIGVGSTVTGVDIPAHKSVPVGAIIDSQDKVKDLQAVTEDQEEFVEEVIEVNRALAAGYNKLFEKNGSSAFGSVGPNGDGDILIDGKDILARKGSGKPVIGNGTIVESSRVIGDVFIGDNSTIGNGTSIRGDEGIPITIGKNARIGTNNTLHSLNDKEIKIGDNFRLGSDSVVHGPLEIGNDVAIGNRAVVFKSNVGNNVVVGDRAIVVGVTVPDGTTIPSSYIVTDQKTVDTLSGKAEASPQKTGTIEETPKTAQQSPQQSPGFEGIIGVIGLLSVICLLRR